MTNVHNISKSIVRSNYGADNFNSILDCGDCKPLTKAHYAEISELLSDMAFELAGVANANQTATLIYLSAIMDPDCRKLAVPAHTSG